ncbi:MAG: FHA domain-containing protein [Planctomycetota bacterium]
MGIRLYVEVDGESGRLLDIEESEVVVGRHAENALVIQDQRSSRRHCRILSTPQGAMLEDLKSANGTLLNGEEVEQSLLNEGDEIRIGKTRIVYGVDAAVPARSAAKKKRKSTQTGTESSGATEAIGSLEIVEGDRAGETVEIAELPFTIGRSRECDLRLKDGKVSSQHARIERRGDAVIVKDLGSKNGITVDSKKIPRGELRSGTRFRVGSHVFISTIVGAPALEAPARPARIAPAAVDVSAADAEDVMVRPANLEGVKDSDRIQQPLIALCAVLVVGFAAYYFIDLAKQILLVAEPDPVSEGNRLSKNWSFEVAPSPETGEIVGWVADDGVEMEVGTSQAQFPGSKALHLTSTNPTKLLGVHYETPAAIGVDTEFVLEGYAASDGAFLAGFVVEWLDGDNLVDQYYSETTQGATDSIDVSARITAPKGCSHARVSCVVFGGSGSAYFDRVSFSTAPEEVEQEQVAAKIDVEVGEAPKALRIYSQTDGTLRIESSNQRLVLGSVWGGLDGRRDSLAIGPRQALATLRAGDRGSYLLSTLIPDLDNETWASVETTVHGTEKDVRVLSKLVSDASEDGEKQNLVLTIQSDVADTKVIGHGEETRSMKFSSASAKGVNEVVIGSRKNRVSMSFTEPVKIRSREHPTLAGIYLLDIRSDSGGRAIEFHLLPGSRSEEAAANAVVQEATRLYISGQVAAARSRLRELNKNYPEQKTALRRSQELLARWDASASRMVEKLNGEIQRFDENPSPVVQDSIQARLGEWGERLKGTNAGTKLRGLGDTLRLRVQSRAAKAAVVEAQAQFDSARSYYQQGLFGLCELTLRSLLATRAGKEFQQDADLMLRRIESKRTSNVSSIVNN